MMPGCRGGPAIPALGAGSQRGLWDDGRGLFARPCHIATASDNGPGRNANVVACFIEGNYSTRNVTRARPMFRPLQSMVMLLLPDQRTLPTQNWTFITPWPDSLSWLHLA